MVGMAPSRAPAPAPGAARASVKVSGVHAELGIDEHVELVGGDLPRDRRRTDRPGRWRKRRGRGGDGARVVGDPLVGVVDERLEARAIEARDPRREVAPRGAVEEEVAAKPTRMRAVAPARRRAARRAPARAGASTRAHEVAVARLQLAVVARPGRRGRSWSSAPRASASSRAREAEALARSPRSRVEALRVLGARIARRAPRSRRPGAAAGSRRAPPEVAGSCGRDAAVLARAPRSTSPDARRGTRRSALRARALAGSPRTAAAKRRACAAASRACCGGGRPAAATRRRGRGSRAHRGLRVLERALRRRRAGCGCARG